MGDPDQSKYPDPTAERPTTPRKLPWLRDAGNGRGEAYRVLQMLGKISNIEFPPFEEHSPEKKIKTPTREVGHFFSVLFFANRSVLEQEVSNFLDWIKLHPDLEEPEERIGFLRRKLKKARYAEAESSRATGRRRGNVRDELAVSAPSSPTRSVKRAPKQT